MKSAQVMIVEDEALVGIDIQENLINYGYNVIGISNSGEAAIESAIKNRPEVILMDIQLKGKMDGIEAAKKIRNLLGIPIIYLTAYADDKTLAKALEASPSGYLLKPFVPRELHSSIQTALHKSNIEKKTKLRRISYIQKNILKNKKARNRVNDNISQIINELKLERLKYIQNSIRKRKKIEIKLLEETKHTSNLENLLGGLLFTQTVEQFTPYLFPLNEFAPMLEYTRDEITRMGNLIIPLLIHPEDFQIIEDYYNQILLSEGSSIEIEFRLKHKSGIWRWFSSKGIYHKLDKYKGKVTHSVRDITWLKNLQYTSHIAREKFVAISNNPYFGIAILDPDGKIMNLNPTLEHLTGYTKDDLNWLNYSDYIGLKELRSICFNFENLKQGLIPSFQTEAFIYTKNRGAFWGYIVFNAIYNQERSLDRIVCTLVDISESKLFERKTK